MPPDTAVDLSVELAAGRGGGLRLDHPVLVAAGGAGFGIELLEDARTSMPGAIFTRGLTRSANRGNPAPRMVATPGGLLSSVGAQNPGLEQTVERYAPRWATSEVPIILNLCANTAEGFAGLARAIDGTAGVAGVEINLSCPDRRSSGAPFGLDAGAAGDVVSAVRAATALPVIAKLTPAAVDIEAIARAVSEAGADAISAINSLPGMTIDRRRRSPALGTVYGGLSGPALKPIALRIVHQVAQVTKVPIVGVGGVATLGDVLDMLMAGASAVGMTTAALADPSLPGRLAQELAAWCRERGSASHREIVGAALPRRRSRLSALSAEYRL